MFHIRYGERTKIKTTRNNNVRNIFNVKYNQCKLRVDAHDQSYIKSVHIWNVIKTVRHVNYKVRRRMPEKTATQDIVGTHCWYHHTMQGIRNDDQPGIFSCYSTCFSVVPNPLKRSGTFLTLWCAQTLFFSYMIHEPMNYNKVYRHINIIQQSKTAKCIIVATAILYIAASKKFITCTVAKFSLELN